MSHGESDITQLTLPNHCDLLETPWAVKVRFGRSQESDRHLTLGAGGALWVDVLVRGLRMELQRLVGTVFRCLWREVYLYN